MPQLSPEGRGDPSPPPGKTLYPLKISGSIFESPFCRAEHWDPGISDPPLTLWFLPTSLFIQQTFVWAYCVLLVANWDWQASNGVGAGPPNRENKASVSSLPPPPAALMFPLSLLRLHWESLSLSQIRHRPWDHASWNGSDGAGHQGGLLGGGGQGLESKEAPTRHCSQTEPRHRAWENWKPGSG